MVTDRAELEKEMDQLVNGKKLESFFIYWDETKQHVKNSKEHEKHIVEMQNIYEKLRDNGIMAAFEGRARNSIFWEDGLKSEESLEKADNSRELHKKIQAACNYDLSNPIEASKWVATLAPYLNDSSYSLDVFAPPLIDNPLDLLIDELTKKGFDKPIATPKNEEEKNHNIVFNALKAISRSDFSSLEEVYIQTQIDLVSDYIDNKDLLLSAEEIKLIPQKMEEAEEIRKSIRKNGVIKTITDILEKYGYSEEVEKELINFKMDGEDNEQYFITDEVMKKADIYLKYLQIKYYGCLVEELNESLEQQEQIMQQQMHTEEMEEYINKMQERLASSKLQDEAELKNIKEEVFVQTGKRKFSLAGLIDRIVRKNEKQEEIVEAKDQDIINKLDEMLKHDGIGSLAYSLRDLKKYINDPKNSLNLSDGRNIVQVVMSRAVELGITVDKTTADLIKENPNTNAVLVSYAKTQISDLAKYGCFLTSKCNDVLKKNKINVEKACTVLKPRVETKEEILPEVVFDMKPIIESALEEKPQSKEEAETITSMLKASVEPTKENVEKAKQMVKQLPAVVSNNTQLAIRKQLEQSVEKKNQEKIVGETKMEKETIETNEIETSLQQKIDKLAELNTKIIDKTGQDIGMRLVEIQDEMANLDREIDRITIEDVFDDEEKNIKVRKAKEKKDKSSSVNGSLLFGVSMGNENLQNMKEVIVEEIISKSKKQVELNNKRLESKKEAEDLEKEIIPLFKENYEKHEQERSNVDKRKKTEKETAKKEDTVLYDYKQVKRLYNEFIAQYIKELKNSKKTNKYLTAFGRLNTYIDSIESKIPEKELETIKKIKELVSKRNEVLEATQEIRAIQVSVNEIVDNELFNEKDAQLIAEEAEEKNKKIEEVNAKKLILEKEETMLSFDPSRVKKELEKLISKGASIEEVSAKVDEMIEPLKSSEVLKEGLTTEIEELEAKLKDNGNYIDEAKLAFEQDKLKIYEKQLSYTDNRIKELQKQLQEQEEIEHLNELKTVLLKEQKSRDEDVQILLRWNIQESESSEEVRNIIVSLMEETKARMEKTNEDLAKCEEELASKEAKEAVDKEQIKEELERLETEKKQVTEKIASQKQLVEERKDNSLVDNQLKLSDQELLESKKQELASLSNENLDRLKEEILEEYSKSLQKEEEQSEVLGLPGAFADGSEIKSDGTIVKPIALPGELEDGSQLKSDRTIEPVEEEFGFNLADDEDDLGEEEIERISEPSPSLLERAKNKFKECGKKVLDWIGKHPKLAAAIGTVVTAVVIAGVAIVKSVSGQDLENEVLLPQEDSIEISQETNDNANVDKTEVEKTVDKVIEEQESEKLTSSEVEETNYQRVFDNVTNNILNGDAQVYRTAQDALDGTNAVNNIFEPSFANADIDIMMADIDNDGKNEILSHDEALKAIEEGKEVALRMANDGTYIGYTVVNNEMANSNQQAEAVNSTGMSR